MSKLAELASGQPIEVETEGGSMFPLIRHGQTVLVKPIDRPIRRGDIVLLVLDGRWVMHRVVRLDNATVTTRGDNQPIDDRATGRAAVQGFAVRVVDNDLKLDWAAPLQAAWLWAAPARRRLVRIAATLSGWG